MQSVLEQLYFGNIRPDSKTYGQDSPFVKAAELKSRNLDDLMNLLDTPGKEAFEKYCDAQGDIEGITQYNTFTYALKFGVLLMTEVFMNSGEVVGENLVL